MEKRHFTENQKKLIGGVAIVIFVVFSAAICWFVGKPMVKFVSEPEKFRMWVDSHGLWSQVAYVGMTLLQVLVAVIPGEPLEISGGYAFGAVQGTVLCMLGAFLGSVVVFAFVRRFGRELVEVFFPKEKIESLRFLQSSPKRDLLCYFAGLTDLSWGKWLLICSLGRVPSIITSTVGGNALGGKNYLFAILVFAGTLAVSAIGLLIYRGLCHRHEKKQNGKT